MLNSHDVRELLSVARQIRRVLASDRPGAAKVAAVQKCAATLAAGLELLAEQVPPPPSLHAQLAEAVRALASTPGAASLKREIGKLRATAERLGESEAIAEALKIVLAIASNVSVPAADRRASCASEP